MGERVLQVFWQPNLVVWFCNKHYNATVGRLQDWINTQYAWDVIKKCWHISVCIKLYHSVSLLQHSTRDIHSGKQTPNNDPLIANWSHIANKRINILRKLTQLSHIRSNWHWKTNSKVVEFIQWPNTTGELRIAGLQFNILHCQHGHYVLCLYRTSACSDNAWINLKGQKQNF